MSSLVILMLETEQPEGLSARKLVVETAKHNVLTAYQPERGLDLLRRFPSVDVVLVHSGLLIGMETLIADIREIVPSMPIIVACPSRSAHFPEADYVVESHRPQQLLDLLAQKFHVSKASDAE